MLHLKGVKSVVAKNDKMEDKSLQPSNQEQC